jgi:hypothetical protein
LVSNCVRRARRAASHPNDLPECFGTERLRIRCPPPVAGRGMHAAVNEFLDGPLFLDGLAQGEQDRRGLGASPEAGEGRPAAHYRGDDPLVKPSRQVRDA